MQTIETRPYPKKLHKYDYPHYGPLCKEIRESRGVPIPQVLKQCNRSNSTITRNLERDGNTSRSTFRCYVKVLRSGLANPPLTRQQGDILMELFDYSEPEEIADRQCELFFFTYQMRLLLCRLHDLSLHHETKFIYWWLQAIRFNLDYDLRILSRTIVYKGQKIRTEVLPRIHQDVKLAPGYSPRYSLAVWNPISDEAREAFKYIRALPESNKIYFAADYDRNRDFHVNSWPEVNSEIEKWISNGLCE